MGYPARVHTDFITMPLKPIKRPGSPYYYARGTVEGQTVFISTKQTGLRAATEECYRLERELRESQSLESIRLFFEAVEAYIKAGGEQRYLGKINKSLGMMPLDKVTQDVIDSKGHEAYPGVKPSTLRRQWHTPIIAILHNAADLKWCAAQRLKKPKEVRPPAEWVDLAWLEKLWEGSNEKVAALTTFLPYTGCRIGECLALTWENVNLEEAWAYIPKTKNKSARTVPLTESVITRLKAIQKEKGVVFEFKDRHAAIREIKRACKRAGIPYKRPHIIGSHTYATWMRRYEGLDSRGLMATGRWKDPRSTFIYSHVIPGEDAQKVHNLPGAKLVQKPKRSMKTTKKHP